MKAVIDTAIERIRSGQNEFTCRALEMACDAHGVGKLEGYELLDLWTEFARTDLPEWWNRSGELRSAAIAERWKQERIDLLEHFKENPSWT